MNSKNLVVYKASAGSGKTFTLVKEYLRLALETDNPDYFKHILAITFTNKAATEMKQRVFKSLAEIAEDRELKEMAELLLSELNLPREELVKRAELTYRSMVYNYSEIGISTIDSFVIKLLKGFTKELGLPTQFEVSLDQDEMLELAIDRLIDKSQSEDYIKGALIEYISYRLNEDKKWEFLEDLKKFSREIFSDKSKTHLQKLAEISHSDFKETEIILRNKNKELEKDFFRVNDELLLSIESSGFILTDFSGGANGPINKLGKLRRNGDFNSFSLTEKQIAMIDGDEWFAKTKNAHLIDQSQPYLNQWRTQIFKMLQLKGDLILVKSILGGLYSMMLMNEISVLVNDIKEEDGSILISDNHKLVNDVVQNNPVPFIYEKIGERFKHLMIDEFQDTSVTQFQNAIPLIENNLSYQNFNLIVGDTKQSIYRFNNGEFEQLAQLPEKIFQKEKMLDGENRETVFRDNGREIQLNKNYRSKNEIIQFNNLFFEFLTSYINNYVDLKGAYQSYKQDYGKNSEGGLVTLRALEKDEYKDRALEMMIQNIRECLDDNYSLSDIAILVRGKTDGAKVALALSEHEDLPFISNDSLRFDSSQDIDLLINVLKQQTVENDLVSGFKVLKYLCLKSENQNLHSFQNEFSYNKDPKELKKDKFNFSKCLAHFGIEKGFDKEHFSLVESIYEIIRIFSIQLNDPFIQQFIDEAQNFGLRRGKDIHGFLDYWDERLSSKGLEIPEGKNALRILTIHKSKGLEYPIVILPFNNYTKGAKGDRLWFDKKNEDFGLPSYLISENTSLIQSPFKEEYESEQNYKFIDTLNLLYVALTRPQDRLYIYFPEEGNSKDTTPKNPEKWFSRFLKDKGELEMTIGNRKRREKENVHRESRAKEYFQTDKDWRSKLVIDKKQFDNYYHYEGIQEKKIEGILIHKIFEKAKKEEDCLKEIKRLRLLLKINHAEEEMLDAKFRSIYSKPEISSILNCEGQILNEKTIVDSNGQIQRPDRMIVTKDQLEIIDFKTGEHDEKHKEQLDSYAETMKDIGYSKIRKSILYFNNEEIISWS